MVAASSPFGFSRRKLLAGLAVAPALTGSAVPTLAQTAAAAQTQAALKAAKGTKLVMLGTAGGPTPGRPRKMTSHVMLSNGAAYILDCGLGVTDRFAETGIPFNALRSIFVKALVISHLVPVIDNDDTWRAAAAKTFKGEIIVAKDLMVL